MARAWASTPAAPGSSAHSAPGDSGGGLSGGGGQGANLGRSFHGREDSEYGTDFLEEEAWGDAEGCHCWRCFITCCAPCYSCCHCAWHVARSTPMTSIVALSSVVAVVFIFRYYLPLLRTELDAAGLHLEERLIDFLESFFLLLLVVDGSFTLINALLTGTTREIFCRSIATGVFEYTPGKRFRCGVFMRCLRSCGGTAIMTFLVCISLGSVFLAGMLNIATVCAWFGGALARYACRLKDDDDNTVVDDDFTLSQNTMSSLVLVLGEGFFWTNFDAFDYTAFCRASATSVVNTTVSRYQVAYQFLFILLCSTCGLVVAQTVFFSLMVDSLRVSRVAVRDYSLGGRLMRPSSAGEVAPR